MVFKPCAVTYNRGAACGRGKGRLAAHPLAGGGGGQARGVFQRPSRTWGRPSQLAGSRVEGCVGGLGVGGESSELFFQLCAPAGPVNDTRAGPRQPPPHAGPLTRAPSSGSARRPRRGRFVAATAGRLLRAIFIRCKSGANRQRRVNQEAGWTGFRVMGWRWDGSLRGPVRRAVGRGMKEERRP